MRDTESSKRGRVLDPVNRVSEIIFGLLMALTFTGSLSVSGAAREEVRAMMFAALGCNLAWGLVDAVMYLVRTAVDGARTAQLLARLRATEDAAAAHALIRDALPERMGAAVDVRVLEPLRQAV